MKKLAETYDVYKDMAGIVKNEQPILLPIAHSTFQAQIEMTVGENGELLNCAVVEQDKKDKNSKNRAVTIIPVTDDSVARGNGKFPHPLCDKLCYIAGDYSKYTNEKKEAYHEAYMEQLREWVESEYSHPMIKLIYKYLKKNTVIEDLVKGGILKLDENGRLTDKIKLNGLGQVGANVRFIVYRKPMDNETSVWTNKELFEKYIQYCRSRSEKKALCYVTGKMEICSEKHPAKIRNSSDKVKLISGNDDSGYRYRGRFITKNQVVQIGYETSQKAHQAL